MHARLRCPNNLLILEPDFPCLAEPRPGMNIKAAAITVSEKYINNCCDCHMNQIASFTFLFPFQNGVRDNIDITFKTSIGALFLVKKYATRLEKIVQEK